MDTDAKEPMMRREPGIRAVCAELERVQEVQKGAGEKAPSYLITTMGSRMNRVVVVGVLTNIRDVTQDQSGFFSAQLEDTTGRITVNAGQYEPPTASAFLRTAEEASIALIIGKPRIWEPEPGKKLVQVKIESARRISPEEFKGFLAEHLSKTLHRAHAHATAIKEPSVVASNQQLMRTVRSVIEAMQKDAPVAPVSLAPTPIHVPAPAAPAPQPPVTKPAPSPVVAPTMVPKPPAPAPPSGPSGDALELKVYQAIKERGTGGVVKWDSIVELRKEWGVTDVAIEAALNNLLNAGRIQEPTLGTLRAD